MYLPELYFLNMVQIGHFSWSSSFYPFKYIVQNLTINGKSLYGVQGIRTRDLRMVGTDESTDLWRPPGVVPKSCRTSMLLMPTKRCKNESVQAMPAAYLTRS